MQKQQNIVVHSAGKFIIPVDHSLTKKQLLQALHCDASLFDFSDQSVPLPILDEKEEVVVELLYFDDGITDEEATKRIQKLGHRRASSREGLSVGIIYQDLGHKFPVVASSTGTGVPSIFWFKNKRYLGVNTDKENDIWGPGCRFVVIPREYHKYTQKIARASK